MTIFLAALLSVTAAPEATTPPLMSVDRVSENIAQLHGRVVDVQGWLGECVMLSCGLFPTFGRAQSGRHGDDMLSIGSAEIFDRRAPAFQLQQVVLRARVNADCRTTHVCTDRAPILEPISIRSVRRRSVSQQSSSGD